MKTTKAKTKTRSVTKMPAPADKDKDRASNLKEDKDKDVASGLKEPTVTQERPSSENYAATGELRKYLEAKLLYMETSMYAAKRMLDEAKWYEYFIPGRIAGYELDYHSFEEGRNFLFDYLRLTKF